MYLEHNANTARVTRDQMFRNGNIAAPRACGSDSIFGSSDDQQKGTTVGGYVLVSHANVSYITHHSEHQEDWTVSLPQTIQPTRLPPLLPLFLILLFSSAKRKQIWRCWFTSVGEIKSISFRSQPRPRRARAATTSLGVCAREEPALLPRRRPDQPLPPLPIPNFQSHRFSLFPCATAVSCAPTRFASSRFV